MPLLMMEKKAALSKKLKQSDPLPLFTVEVNFKEFTTRSFIFPIPFNLSELENEVVQMFNLEGTKFTLLYLDEEGDCKPFLL